MPKITLEFEVLDKGTAVIRQVSGEVEKGMKAIGAAGTTAASGTFAAARAAEGAGVSFRTLRMGAVDLAMSLGVADPMLTNVALGLGHVMDRMSGASTSAKFMGGAVLAAAGGIAFLVAQAKATDEVAKRFETIDQAVARMDFKAVQEGLAATRTELAGASKEMDSWIGSFVLGGQNIVRTLARIPNTIEEGNQALATLRSGLEHLTTIQIAQQAAEHTGAMAGLSITGRQQFTQSLAGRGLLTPDLIKTLTEGAKADLQSVFEAATQAAFSQRQKESMEASSRGTLDIESPAIQARYVQRTQELSAKRDIQLAQATEQARQQTLGVGEQQTRATQMGAGFAAEQQNARVEALKQQVEASAKLQEEFKKNFNITGMFPTVGPLAKQLVEEEKTARLMAIDDTLKKNLSSIDQMKIAEEEKVKLLGQANQTAEMQRANAIAESVVKTNDLYDAVAKARDQVTGMAADVQTKLVGGIDAAAAAMKQVGDNTSVIGMPGSAFQSKPGQLSDAWKEFWQTPKTGPGSLDWWSGGAWGNNAWSRSTQPLGGLPPGAALGGEIPATPGSLATYQATKSQYAYNTPALGDYPGAQEGIVTPALGDYPGAQEGIVVPGPVGSPTLIKAHGGEVVLNPREQDVVRSLVGRGGAPSRPAGPAVIMVQVGSAQLVRAVIPDLQRLIDDRSIRVS